MTVIVEVPEPGAAIEVGLKLTVTPEGWPVALSATAELKPPLTVEEMVEVPLFPCTMETAVPDSAKPGPVELFPDNVSAASKVYVVPSVFASAMLLTAREESRAYVYA